METEELNTMLNLTKRDMDVLNILWESDEPKTATMISKSGDGLTMNTTQAVLRKLLKNNLIEIADIVYSGTVLTRSYKSVICQEEFLLQKLVHQYKSMSKKGSKAAILAILLDSEEDPERLDKDLKEIKEFIKNYRKKRFAGN